MVAIKIIEWEDKYAEQFKRLSLSGWKNMFLLNQQT
jgi:hypothetical protein